MYEWQWSNYFSAAIQQRRGRLCDIITIPPLCATAAKLHLYSRRMQFRCDSIFYTFFIPTLLLVGLRLTRNTGGIFSLTVPGWEPLLWNEGRDRSGGSSRALPANVRLWLKVPGPSELEWPSLTDPWVALQTTPTWRTIPTLAFSTLLCNYVKAKDRLHNYGFIHILECCGEIRREN